MDAIAEPFRGGKVRTVWVRLDVSGSFDCADSDSAVICSAQDDGVGWRVAKATAGPPPRAKDDNVLGEWLCVGWLAT